MTADKGRVTVRVQGQGDELVLLHGWGMHSGVWNPIVDQLAERYRVTLIDLPGHGQNADVSADSMESIGALLAAAAPQNAIWVGWSLGGLVAQWMALEYPGHVRCLVPVASTPRFVQMEGWQQAMVPEVLEQFAQSLSQDYEKTLQRFLALQTRGSAHAQQLLREMRSLLLQSALPRAQALNLGLALLRDTDLRSRLGGIAAPVCWIFGENDALVPVQVSASIQTLMPDAEIVVLEHAGHAPFLSHAQAFMAALTGFMDR